jgi:hypothetical protein
MARFKARAQRSLSNWIPASAGMTAGVRVTAAHTHHPVIPAKAGIQPPPNTSPAAKSRTLPKQLDPACSGATMAVPSSRGVALAPRLDPRFRGDDGGVPSMAAPTHNPVIPAKAGIQPPPNGSPATKSRPLPNQLDPACSGTTTAGPSTRYDTPAPRLDPRFRGDDGGVPAIAGFRGEDGASGRNGGRPHHPVIPAKAGIQLPPNGSPAAKSRALPKPPNAACSGATMSVPSSRSVALAPRLDPRFAGMTAECRQSLAFAGMTAECRQSLALAGRTARVGETAVALTTPSFPRKRESSAAPVSRKLTKVTPLPPDVSSTSSTSSVRRPSETAVALPVPAAQSCASGL